MGAGPFGLYRLCFKSGEGSYRESLKGMQHVMNVGEIRDGEKRLSDKLQGS